ncbi:MAG: DUF368 domain-containing protein, partial [Lachnospiraceae bacterium]|nr:DUF368 domain-containing protein [Lachnospiraceae bacterium]
ISGSTLLLIFGLYLPVMTGIKELLHFQFSYLGGLVIFGLGVIAGALSVVKGIKICLEKYRSKTMYVIMGLMIGSIFAIVMGPATLDVPQAPLSFSTFHWISFLVGIFIVAGLQFAGKNRAAKKSMLEKQEG